MRIPILQLDYQLNEFEKINEFNQYFAQKEMVETS